MLPTCHMKRKDPTGWIVINWVKIDELDHQLHPLYYILDPYTVKYNSNNNSPANPNHKSRIQISNGENFFTPSPLHRSGDPGLITSSRRFFPSSTLNHFTSSHFTEESHPNRRLPVAEARINTISRLPVAEARIDATCDCDYDLRLRLLHPPFLQPVQATTIASSHSEFMDSNTPMDDVNNANRDDDDDDDDGDCVEIDDVGAGQLKKTGKRKREKKQTSPVWNVFELLKTKDANGVEVDVVINGKRRAKCKWCGEIKNYDSATGNGNLMRHIRKCYRENTPDIGQMLLGKDRDSLKLKSSKLNPDIFREKLVRAIVMHNLPLCFVDYIGIKDLFAYVSEELNLISRNTVRADIVNMHSRETNKLSMLLKEAPGRICLTSDLWSSITTDGYISLTTHFVDKNWILQKRLLNFSEMPPPHNAILLSEKVYSMLASWGIEGKLFSITLDNASANDTFVNILKLQLNVRKALIKDGQFFHIRCCAHILNLIVQDGLKEIDGCVYKVRESVKYVKGSNARKRHFVDCVKLVSLDPKRGLRQDVSTRWNSTYLMLRNALYFCTAFTHMGVSDSNYKLCPTSDEWDRIEVLSKFLCSFYDIICMFSGSLYPTSNLYFPSILMARLTLEKHRDSDNERLQKMSDLMFAKSEKYWADFSLILAIDVVFDPRYKIQTVEWGYKKIYGENSSQFEEVKSTLVSLFDIYHVNSSTRKNDGSTSKDVNDPKESTDGIGSGVHTNEAWEEFDSFDYEYGISTKKSELELYLEEPRMPRLTELNILDYWRGQQARYPDLTAMARDILTIPVSTVASESAFSVGAKVIDKYRTALKSDITEAIICTKDWIFGDAKYNGDDAVNEIVELETDKEGPSSTRIIIRVVFVFGKFVSCKFVSDTDIRHGDTDCQMTKCRGPCAHVNLSTPFSPIPFTYWHPMPNTQEITTS
ncbi:hypothetical protein LXL04_007187 [Taraxacum kok-saghyz]